MNIDKDTIERALRLLGEILERRNAPKIALAVCSGAALISLGWVQRTTHDVDIVALIDPHSGELCSPAPLPQALTDASRDVAEALGLEDNWLNNGPSRGEGGIYQVGLPKGFNERLTEKKYSDKLSVSFIGRLDQICFKTFAAADQGPGRHFDDLQTLKPSIEELSEAADWAITQDPSIGFHTILRDMIRSMGYEKLAERV